MPTPPAAPGPPAPPSADAGTGRLDPAVLVAECMETYQDANNAMRTRLKGSVFAEQFKGRRFRYVGLVDEVKPDKGQVRFKGAGSWPRNYKVLAEFPPDQRGALDRLTKGQQLTIEAEVTELDLPGIDVGGFGKGPSRTIKMGAGIIRSE